MGGYDFGNRVINRIQINPERYQVAKPSFLGLTILAFWLCFSNAARSEHVTSVRDFVSASDVSTRAKVITPEKPIGYVILLPGGDGDISLSPSGAIGSPKMANNFSVRTRNMFADAGLITLVVDAPCCPIFGLYKRDQYLRHIEALRTIAKTLKKESNLPLWIVGTSASAGRLALMTPEIQDDVAIAGIALTSTTFSLPSMSMAEAAKIRVPVLVVHHREDGCAYCKPEAVQPFVDMLGTPAKKLVWIEGGVSQGNPCHELAFHGFNGKESEAVGAVIRWIKG